MKSTSWLRILLIVAGALVLAYQGINYTREKKVIDMGPMHVTQETHERNSASSNTWRAGVGWRGRPAGRWGAEQVIGPNRNHNGARLWSAPDA
jgi:hypothetical protein